MEKRILAVLATLLFGLFLCELSVYSSASGEELAQAAQQQSLRTLTVTETRGTIYDSSLTPLTGGKNRWIAAVSPGIESLAALNSVFSQDEMAEILPSFQEGAPFLLEVPSPVSALGIQTFSVPERYSEDTQAIHILGYLDDAGAGVCGAEKSFESILSQDPGVLSITYQVDALQRELTGQEPQVTDSTSRSRAGVVLTLDAKIQEIAETAAEKYLEKGAVVIAQVPDCSLKAVVSLPSYSPANPSEALTDPDSPLLNRAFSAYSVGSVFKLISASAALEYGLSTDIEYTCTGSTLVSSSRFHCYNGNSHGTETMKDAIANSCNTYFIHLMQMLPSSRFLEMAEAFGFGSELELMPGSFSAAGVLPSSQTLSYPKGLANFSFGQGELTATPVQVTAMINTIASGGIYTEPYLYQGTVDEFLSYTEQKEDTETRRLLKPENAAFLQEAMIEASKRGSGRIGNPVSNGGAGIKTATAQTGRYDEEGNEINQCWYAGFWPAENPQYVITVFSEDGDGGGTDCGPVFREIAERLSSLPGTD